MLRAIPLGQHVAGDSIVHRHDPRVNVILVMVFVAALFVVRGPLGYLMMAGFCALAVRLTGIAPGFVLKGLRGVYLIIVLTLALHLFMTPGDPLFRLGPLRATREGAGQGGLLALRLVLLVTTTSLLTLTTSPIDLTDALERLLKPLRRVGVPAHEIAMMMSIALRFIPTLKEEAEKVIKAQMARGADFESKNLLRRARSLVPVLVPLFVGAFRRADDLAIAMEARCYRGGEGRTRMKQLRAGAADAAAAAVTALVAAGAVLSRLHPWP